MQYTHSIDGDGSSALSRQHLQIQQDRATREKSFPPFVEKKEDGGGWSESHRRAVGSRMSGHPFCSIPGCLSQFTSQSPKAASATSLWPCLQRQLAQGLSYKCLCKTFADISAWKLVDLAQEQVTFHKLSTSSKICLNFHSLIPNP